MDSDIRNECSHSLGFPIRKSPDHSLLAASRGLSQLTTSFFAFLRLGIHTHALSSLTIKSTSHTFPTGQTSTDRACERYYSSFAFAKQNLCFVYARQYSIVKDLDCAGNRFSGQAERTAGKLLGLVGLGGIEPPTSPLSGVRSSQLSYRPGDPGGAGRDRTGDLLNANQALSQLSYSPAFLPRPVGRKDHWSCQ